MYQLLLSALISTFTLFIAHACPINDKYVESYIKNNPGKKLPWIVAFLYYYIIFIIVDSLLMLLGYSEFS